MARKRYATKRTDAPPRAKANPLYLEKPKPPRAQQDFKRLEALRVRENSRALPGQTGYIQVGDYSPSGRRTGTALMSTRVDGQTTGNPSLTFAYLLRARMRPIKTARALVRDAVGAIIAQVTVDPVTGARRREPYVPCRQCGEAHP